MARTAALRVSTDTASIYVSVHTPRTRRAPARPVRDIDWHISQICQLAELHVLGENWKRTDYGARIAKHKLQLAALGVDEIGVLSFVNRAAVPE